MSVSACGGISLHHNDPPKRKKAGNRVACSTTGRSSAGMTGPVFILAFVILSAFRDVFFSGALRAAPFFTVAFIAFATCTVAFLVVALFERQRTRVSCSRTGAASR